MELFFVNITTSELSEPYAVERNYQAMIIFVSHF